MRFDDLDYCVDLIERNQYPKIHDDIFLMCQGVKADTVLDLGCCHGLLSCRLATIFDKVIGLEPSDKYIRNAIPRDNVDYVRLGITMKTLGELKDVIAKNKVNLIVARRVIPEIWETGGFELVNGFVDTVHEADVKYIALEGRKPTKKPRNPLYNADRECEVMQGKYIVEDKYKNCRLLRRL